VQRVSAIVVDNLSGKAFVRGSYKIGCYADCRVPSDSRPFAWFRLHLRMAEEEHCRFKGGSRLRAYDTLI
jgi:hypothetical protein